MKFLQRFSKKTLSRINMVLVFAAFILVNMLASRAVEKFGLTLDFTAAKLYELSPITVETAAAIKTETVITVFANETDYPQVFKEILARYKKLSPFIRLTYVDQYENPVLADVYRQKGFSLAENDAVVEGANRAKHLSAQTMITTDAAGTIQAIGLEQHITAALLYVNSTAVPSVFFTEGHNERPSTALLDLFTNNNFALRRGVAAVTGFDGADIAVIASPSRDFAANEIQLLNAFLEEGGKLMIFLEPQTAEFTVLSDFLAQWNIQPQNNTIFDERAHMANNPANCIPHFMPHQITRFFADTRLFAVVPASRSFTLTEENPAVHTRDLLRTASTAYAKYGVPTTQTKEANDAIGSFTLAAISEKQVLSASGVKTASVFVCGSKNFYADDILHTQSYANQDFLIQTVNYLSRTPLSVNIPPKTLLRTALGIVPAHSMLIALIIIGLIPLAIFVIGIIVFVRRKNL